MNQQKMQKIQITNNTSKSHVSFLRIQNTFNKHPVEGGEVEEEGKHPAGAVHLVKHGHRHICR